MTCSLNSVKKMEAKKLVDLESAGYEKLLGGGKLTNAYSVKVATIYGICPRKTKSCWGK